ncbi:MAG: UDP-N-acetylmuramyl-tripeptide synthetase [Patescibacteria group bacterium]
MNLWERVKRWYHFVLVFLGNLWYGFPSKEIFLVGVTGTKGKSTVAELISWILESAGKKTAVLSSVRVKVGDESHPNETGNTMPGRFAIPKFLRAAVRAKCEYAIVEVTSQGVAQYRHRFLDFDTGIFLNLHPEHIEAHGSFEAYRAAKVRFFEDIAKRSCKARKSFFVNGEDRNRDHFFDAAHQAGDFKYFSRENFVEMKLARGKVSIGDWLENDFNLENAAAATKFAESRGIPWETIRRALASFRGIPGRMEIVQEKPFRVIVDYAHTPDSLRAAYRAVTDGTESRKRNLICVLSSDGGSRDKWKRPELGKIAAEFCREIVITEENSYGDDVRNILTDVRSGIPKEFPHERIHEISDRREAMRLAVKLAKRGDTVIATGKGSEPFLRRGKSFKIRWNDRVVFEEALQALSASSKN